MMSIVRNCEMFCCETCPDHVRNGLCFDLTPAGVHDFSVQFCVNVSAPCIIHGTLSVDA